MVLLKFPKSNPVLTGVRLLSLLFASLVLLFPAGAPLAPAWSADNTPLDGQDTGRIGCPGCLNDGSEVSRLLRRGDDLYASLKTKEALGVLFQVLRLDPQNHEALSKTARAYVDLGDRIPQLEPGAREKRLEQYRTAEKYARKAVLADPDSTWGHFYVAVSLGKLAMLLPLSQQIDLSREIRAEVENAIAADPENGFAYHIYGVWHRKMAEIGRMRRVLANVVLWRSVPGGSLEKSVEYLTKAISLNPRVIAHYLELGKTYIAMGQWQLARKALNHARELPSEFSDDPRNKKEALELLRKIKDR